jgi:hypothetical protein
MIGWHSDRIDISSILVAGTVQHDQPHLTLSPSR